LYDVSKKLNVDIILLQQTHSCEIDESKWYKEWDPVESVFNSAKNNLQYTQEKWCSNRGNQVISCIEKQ